MKFIVSKYRYAKKLLVYHSEMTDNGASGRWNHFFGVLIPQPPPDTGTNNGNNSPDFYRFSDANTPVVRCLRDAS